MRVSSLLRPVHAAVVGLAATIALLVVAGAQADDPTALRETAGQLAQENRFLDEQRQAALLELYALESDLEKARKRISSLEQRVATVEEKTALAKKQLGIARDARDEAQRQLGEQLVTLYIQGDIDPLEVMLGAESLSDAISAADDIRRLADVTQQIVELAAKTERSLRSALRNLNEKEAELDMLTAEAAAAHAALSATKLERTAFIEGLAQRQSLNESRIAELVSEAAVIEKRASELNRAAAPAAAESSAPKTKSTSSPAQPASPVAVDSSPGAVDAAPTSGKKMVVDAVAYSLPGYTASGLPVGPGVVAVDPSVIPLGTKMYIPGYGEGIAADTGSAIKGAIIDLWFPTYGQAAAWGRKRVTITIR